MAMDRARVPLSLNARDSARKTEIEAYVAGLIADRGYYWVINHLMAGICTLAEKSLADPWNLSKQLDFTLWVNAVRTAIQRHSEESTFEHRVNDSDRAFAQEMGIILD
jgi:acyl-ACP thioesterase